MSFQALNRGFAVALLLIAGWFAISTSPAWGQVEVNRKVKVKVAPVYPELARRLNITGVVKIEITVSTAGSIKNAKVIGGHPVLATAALDAARRWRFEAGPQDTTGTVEFRFDPATQ